MTDYKISTELLAEITAERQRQIDKGTDDYPAQGGRCKDIIWAATRAKNCVVMNSLDAYRRRMKQIAALAIAACENYDRLNKTGE